MSAPNIGEKIAATYLRLNGFLLLHHFTVFIKMDGHRVRHIDLLGLRAKNSKEIPFDNGVCKLDETFFKLIEDDFKIPNPKSIYLGVVTEVRTNQRVDYPQREYCDYAKNFLGDAQQIALAFTRTDKNFLFEQETLVINLDYALKWILARIDHMERELEVRKTESWFLSDEFLADILILRKLGLPMK